MSAQGWKLLLDSIQTRKAMELAEREAKRKEATEYIKQLQEDADKRIAQDLAERRQTNEEGNLASRQLDTLMGFLQHMDTQAGVNERNAASAKTASEKATEDKAKAVRDDTRQTKAGMNTAWLGGLPVQSIMGMVDPTLPETAPYAQSIVNPAVAQAIQSGRLKGMDPTVAAKTPMVDLASMMSGAANMAGEFAGRAGQLNSQTADAKMQNVASLIAERAAREQGIEADNIWKQARASSANDIVAAQLAQMRANTDRTLAQTAKTKIETEYVKPLADARLARERVSTEAARARITQINQAVAQAGSGSGVKQGPIFTEANNEYDKYNSEKTKRSEQIRKLQTTAAQNASSLGYTLDFKSDKAGVADMSRSPGYLEKDPAKKFILHADWMAASDAIRTLIAEQKQSDAGWQQSPWKQVRDATFTPKGGAKATSSPSQLMPTNQLQGTSVAPVIRPGMRLQGGNVTVYPNGKAPAVPKVGGPTKKKAPLLDTGNFGGITFEVRRK